MRANKYYAKAIWHCLDCDMPFEKGQLGTKNCPRCHGPAEHFHSKGEHARWCVLKIDPAVTELRRQVRYPLATEGRPILTPKGRQAVYVSDFSYRFKGALTVEDFKGHDTPLSRFKRAVFEAQYQQKVTLTGVPMRGRLAA